MLRIRKILGPFLVLSILCLYLLANVFTIAGLPGLLVYAVIIDGYESGYNHGLFNGIDTILGGGSILR